MTQRYLKRNKACRSPTRLIFWDTETTQEPSDEKPNTRENVFRLAVASRVRLDKGRVTRRVLDRFRDQGSFWDWIETGAKTNTQTYVFAHNLAFDATVSGLWFELDRGRFRLSDNTSLDIVDDPRDPRKKPWTGLFVREDPPTIIKVRTRNNATITFCDTLNWFKTSLEKLGERIGLVKLPMPAFEESDEVWFEYCTRDVVVIERTICDYVAWLRDNDLGNFKLTAPSQAFAAFNHRFRKPNILIHSKPEVQSLERESYYGGRLESYYIGEVGEQSFGGAESHGENGGSDHDHAERVCYALDVNSLYPSVMRKLPYPTGLEEYRDFRSPVPLRGVGLCHRCIADVHVQCDETFPRRVPGVGIVFAKGRFRTTLCGPELERALDCGAVTHVYRYARYSLKPLFTEYVDFFWNERVKAKAAGDIVGDLFCKLFLNSLYGKFGQLSVEWEELGRSLKGHEWDTSHEYLWQLQRAATIQNIAGVQYLKQKREDHPKSFCAIASFVTAYARERMLNLMETAGREHVHYIVTDGIVVDRDGRSNLARAGELDDHTLGKLSEKAAADVAWLGGVHWYEIGDLVKQGSNKKKAVVLSTGHAIQERWERLSGILKRGPTDTVRITPQIKFYSRQYKRGTVLPNGNVIPLVYDEPPEGGSND